jgi:hypothetical protein
MRVRCERLAEELPALVDGVELGETARAHVQRCLRCQADVARDRRLHRLLAGLRHDAVVPPAGLLAEVFAVLDTVSSGPYPPVRDRRRVAYLGTIAAATAAGVGGVLVLAARGRRLAG